MCDHWLNRIACPGDLRVISGCGRMPIGTNSAVCKCGAFDVSSTRIDELIIDVSLQRRYDLIPYTGFATLTTINMCTAFEEVCQKMLDHV